MVGLSFGIYFGNSTCSVAVNRNGKTEVVANASGDRVTPVIIGVQDTEVVTGTAAKQGLVRHHRCSITGALRAIGSVKGDNLNFPLDLKCKLVYDTKIPKYAIQNDDKNRMISPDEVIKQLFALLKEIASSHCNDDQLPVVITLPAWISDSAVAVVNHSANLAGFNVLRFVTQPAAACLAYNLLENKENNINALVIHCGGTSLVASVVEISSGLLSIKETSSSHVAGDQLTSILVNHLAKEFLAKYKGDPLENRRSHRKLYNVAENCKHVLSTNATSPVHAESLWEGVDFSSQMSRARFEGLISSTINDFIVTVIEVLQRCNMQKNQIHKVILTGGCCKIPKLQKLFVDKFPEAEVLKHIAPNETLAVGAAMEAALHLTAKPSKKSRNASTILSCIAAPLYATIKGSEKSELVFGLGTPCPSRNSLNFEYSTSNHLLIYEADSFLKEPSKEHIIAEVQLASVDEGAASVKVDFHLKNDTNILVRVTQGKSTKTFSIEAEKTEE